jgi:hypothetical protein
MRGSERGHAMGRVWIVVSIIAGVLIVYGATAVQSAPAGLIIEVTGTIEPAIRPGSEIVEGMELRLARHTTLSFVYYTTCRLVTMKGGTVRLHDGRYAIDAARQVKEEKVTCVVAPLAPGGGRIGPGAGVILRSLDGLPRVGHRPTIVVGGAQAAQVERVVVRDGERVVAELPLAQGRAVWSASTAPLAEGRTYVFQFDRRDGTRVEYPVGVQPTRGSEASALALFRVE